MHRFYFTCSKSSSFFCSLNCPLVSVLNSTRYISWRLWCSTKEDWWCPIWTSIIIQWTGLAYFDKLTETILHILILSCIKCLEQTRVLDYLLGTKSARWIRESHRSRRSWLSLQVLSPSRVITAGSLKKLIPLSLSDRLLQPTTAQKFTMIVDHQNGNWLASPPTWRPEMDYIIMM